MVRSCLQLEQNGQERSGDKGKQECHYIGSSYAEKNGVCGEFERV